MRYRPYLFAVWLGLSSLCVASFADPAPDAEHGSDIPVSVRIPVERAFIPTGFDSNDRAQAMVLGSFSNTCFRVGPVRAEVDRASHTIKIRATAYHYFGNCPRLKVPFAHVVDFGVLPKGEYQLVDGNGGKQLGALSITQAARSQADDYLYLPVSDAYVRHDKTTDENHLIVTGMQGTQCHTIKETRVSYYKDVIVVQPISEVADRCDSLDEAPTADVVLKPGAKGLFLLHVRSLNGEAVNKLVQLK